MHVSSSTLRSGSSLHARPCRALASKPSPCPLPLRKSLTVRASASSSASDSPNAPSFTSKLSSFVSSQFLPIALSSALLLGTVAPDLGAAAAKTKLQSVVTAVIFILSGLQIKQGEALQAVKSPGSLLYGLVAILIMTPMMGLLMMQLPLEPSSLSMGLAVFMCMPTALSSGIAMTQQVGGNVAMAILLTVTSNVVAVFTMPHVVAFVLGSVAGGFNLDPQALCWQLIQLVLVPCTAGALVRGLVPGVAGMVDANKKIMGYLSAICLSMVPWMQVSKAMLQNVELPLTSLLSVAAYGISAHVFFLIVNFILVRGLNLGKSENAQQQKRIQQVLILLCSQKTLPVAVAVLTKLSAVMGPSVGLGAVAAVICHLSQIIVDSFLVSWWINRYGMLDAPPKAA